MYVLFVVTFMTRPSEIQKIMSQPEHLSKSFLRIGSVPNAVSARINLKSNREDLACKQ